MIVETLLSSLVPQIISTVLTEGSKELSSFLLHEVQGKKNIKNEFEEIKEELDCMKVFLENVEANKTHISDNEALMNQINSWAKQVRRQAYQVEDLIDQLKNLAQSRSTGGLAGSAHKILHYADDNNIRRNLDNKVREVSARIHAISTKRNQYQLPTAPRHQTNIGQGSSSMPNKVEILFGIEQKKDELLKWLLHGERQRMVVSICGMAGVGKTALASEVLHHPEVSRFFKHYAWICVPQFDNVRDLVEGIKKQLQDKSEQKEVDVWSNRYLIVLDDVRNFDVWVELNKHIPKNKLQSRVVLTTRNHNLKSFIISNSVINLEPLNDNDARALFYKHTFKDEKCPPELEFWAKEIINKCGGLPLALVAIAHVMSLRGTSVVEWQRTSKCLDWELRINPMLGTMTRSLMLSYNSLPYHQLKRCFLYCSLFPEDHLIKTNRLVKLLIAEGFMDDQSEWRMEDIAEDYISQLCKMSMLQVIKEDESGRPRLLRVHKLMREMAIIASEGENQYIDSSNQLWKVDEYCRRLSIQKSIDRAQPNNHLYNLEKNNHLSGLRTLLVFSQDLSLQSISSSLKLLCVLELRGAPISVVPDNVLQLYNLRYLSLRDTEVHDISPTIENLHNLQTLDLWNTRVTKIPREILKLQKLRHLFKADINAEEISYRNFGHILRGKEALSNLWELTSLQSLRSIEVNDDLVSNIGNLVQLRSLEMAMLDEKHGKDLSCSLSKIQFLIRLSLKAKTKQFLTLKTISVPPPLLQKLILNGLLGEVPIWLSQLHNLRHLSMFGSQLGEADSPIPFLQELQYLEILKLDDAYCGSNLCFPSGSFPRLKKLSLWNIESLVQLDIEKGAMPNLQELSLFNLKSLQIVDGIDHFSQLQVLPPEMKHLCFPGMLQSGTPSSSYSRNTDEGKQLQF